MADHLNRPLILVGCGKMGGSLLSGWLDSGVAAAGVHVVEPGSGADVFSDVASISLHASLETMPEVDPEVVVFAIKPQQADEAVPDYQRFARPDTLFLSIAAGKTIAFFEERLGMGAAVVRAMPNTPAAIGQGISVACPNVNTEENQRAMALTLLEAVGEAFMVEDEALLDAVTAVSGGGPAYVFLLMEAMTEAGIKAGLPTDLAARLSLVTVAGAGQLALHSNDSPSVLRQNVTSPGGTTLEALNVLMSEGRGIQDLIIEAIAAATRRSKELAG